MSLTSEDRAVVNAVWDGRIPACFRLAAYECTSLEPPEPFFVMLPRVSYFPFVWEKVQRHFSRSVASEHATSPLWLETASNAGLNSTCESGHDGGGDSTAGSSRGDHRASLVALRWHLPIGLLYDLHGGGVLPWTIIVHFSDYPEKELIPCPTRQVAEAHFMNSVKEADFLKTRKKIMTAMTQSERRQIASALLTLQTDQFWTVNRKLMFTNEPWKHIPLRIFLTQSVPAHTGEVYKVHQLQKLVAISGADGCSPDDTSRPLTLRRVLYQWLANSDDTTALGKTSKQLDKTRKAEARTSNTSESKPTKVDKPAGDEREAGGDATANDNQHEQQEQKGDVETRPLESQGDSGDKQAAEGKCSSQQDDCSPEQNDTLTNVKSGNDNDDNAWGADLEVTLHGVPAPLDVPLLWLAINMSYADNFLYVVVRQRKTQHA